MNWIKPIFKVKNKHNVSNYCTIMMSSIIAKLCTTTMEWKVSAWIESQNKRALGQAGSKSQHSTTDYLVKVRLIMEESRLQGKTLYCCLLILKEHLIQYDKVNFGIEWWKLAYTIIV